MMMRQPYHYSPHNHEQDVDDEMYSTVQYLSHHAYLPPMTPPQAYQQYQYPGPPPQAQQMYYGSWTGAQHHQDYGHDGRVSSYSYQPIDLQEHNARDHKLRMIINHVMSEPNSTLFDIQTIIPDIACFDEDGSRFVNERLRSGTLDEQELAMKVALLGKDDLWVDNYGRFVIQGLFEFGTDKMKEELVARLCGRDVVSLCMHKNGCRVIQKAIRCLPQVDLNKLILKIRGKVLTLSRDPNGNHVVQRLIQVMSSFATIEDKDGTSNAAASSQIQFIIDDIIENIEDLSTHCYGCRVVQLAIKHCVDEQKYAVVEQIISCDVETLICDRYGNYVIQAVLFNGSEEQIASIIERLTESDQLLKFARQKYASNIIETILEHGEPEHKKKLVEGMLLDTRYEEGGYCCLVELAKDRIANYVVNKALENCEGGLQEELFELLSSNYQELSKSRYGKYVLQTLRKHQSASA